jgi:Streptomyces sporulation and cell division protein, SsgA
MDSTKNTDPTLVARTMTIESIDDTGAAEALRVELSYDPRDPFAVSVHFGDPGPAVRWIFARDLLIDGLYEPSGDGDVHVFPSLDSSGLAVVCIELSSPDGEALLVAHPRELTEFVDLMRAAVPPGSESTHFEIGDTVADLFGTEAG